MTILKKGSYNGAPICNLDYSTMDLSTEDKTDNIKFSKEEYLSLIEEAKKEGYNQGLQNGYDDGYTQGVSKFEEEKESLYKSLESDTLNVKNFLRNESILYVNKFQQDMQKLIANSINKIFFNCIDNDTVLVAYLNELLTYLINSIKEFSIQANTFTINKISGLLDTHNISYTFDDSLSNYNIVVVNENENIEYFLEDEFKKIQELFE